MKITNKIFAMEAAPAAIPPKPKIAAIMATTRKMTVQRNITYNLLVKRLIHNIYLNNRTKIVFTI